MSYGPVIDLLKAYFAIHDHDDTREIREKVAGKLLSLDPALRPTLPAFLALLDVPGDDPSWQTLEPAQRRQRTHDAVRRLLLREASERPLIVIFEDLHWTDSETQALLDGLVDSLPSARLLLLVSYRPEFSIPGATSHAIASWASMSWRRARPSSFWMLFSAMTPGSLPSSGSSSSAAIRSSSRRQSERWLRRVRWPVSRAGIG
jgi:hypothetical protein